jgi:hypothetical protein
MGRGWQCSKCKKNFGKESEKFNVKMIYDKVESIAQDMHDDREVYISNGSMGYSIIATVTKACEDKKIYTEEFIKQQIKIVSES